MITLSKSNEPTPTQLEVEGRIAALLSRKHSLLIIPELYYLTPEHPAIEKLKACGISFCLTWQYPRAAKWIFESYSLESDSVRFMNFNDLALMADQDLVKLFDGLQDESNPSITDLYEKQEKRWHPVLDYDRCVNCGKCAEFCLFGVYSRDGSGIDVVRPGQCKPGCPACAKLCPVGAIIFPDCQTDEGVAGKEGIAIESGDVDSARNFARNNIKAYNEMKDGKEEETAAPGHEETDPIDSLIDELEDLES